MGLCRVVVLVCCCTFLCSILLFILNFSKARSFFLQFLVKSYMLCRYAIFFAFAFVRTNKKMEYFLCSFFPIIKHLSFLTNAITLKADKKQPRNSMKYVCTIEEQTLQMQDNNNNVYLLVTILLPVS